MLRDDTVLPVHPLLKRKLVMVLKEFKYNVFDEVLIRTLIQYVHAHFVDELLINRIVCYMNEELSISYKSIGTLQSTRDTFFEFIEDTESLALITY